MEEEDAWGYSSISRCQSTCESSLLGGGLLALYDRTIAVKKQIHMYQR